MTRSGRFACWIIACLAVVACGPVAADTRETTGPLARQLEATWDLSLSDSSLAEALRALEASTGLVGAIEGRPPTRRVSLRVSGLRGDALLDAIASLYGVRWRPRLTTIVFYTPVLDQEIDLSFQDQDVTGALKAFNAAAGTSVRLDAKGPWPRRASLAAAGSPAREVLSAIASIYGLSLSETADGIALTRASRAPEMGDRRLAGLMRALHELKQEQWGEEDATADRLCTELSRSLEQRAATLKPGQEVPFSELTATEKAMVLEYVQRRAVGGLIEGYWDKRKLRIEPGAAIDGTGIAVNMSHDGSEVALVVPQTQDTGRRHGVLVWTRDGGPPRHF